MKTFRVPNQRKSEKKELDSQFYSLWQVIACIVQIFRYSPGSGCEIGMKIFYWASHMPRLCELRRPDGSVQISSKIYKIWHKRIFFFGLNAALTAIWKTSSTSSSDFEEHSKYAVAPIWPRIFSPSCGVTSFDFLPVWPSALAASPLRSFLLPTRIFGARDANWWIYV